QTLFSFRAKVWEPSRPLNAATLLVPRNAIVPDNARNSCQFAVPRRPQLQTHRLPSRASLETKLRVPYQSERPPHYRKFSALNVPWFQCELCLLSTERLAIAVCLFRRA